MRIKRFMLNLIGDDEFELPGGWIPISAERQVQQNAQGLDIATSDVKLVVYAYEDPVLGQTALRRMTRLPGERNTLQQ